MTVTTLIALCVTLMVFAALALAAWVAVLIIETLASAEIGGRDD